MLYFYCNFKLNWTSSKMFLYHGTFNIDLLNLITSNKDIQRMYMICEIINILHKNNLRYYRINWNIEEKQTFYWMKWYTRSENITVSAILSNTHACIPGFENFSFGIYCKTFCKKINFQNQLYKWYHYFWICLPRISMMSLYSIK